MAGAALCKNVCMTENAMHAKPRRALVTGASGDIGVAICAALADAGHFVYAQAHANPARAQTAIDEIHKNGGAGEVLTFDIANAHATANPGGGLAPID